MKITTIKSMTMKITMIGAATVLFLLFGEPVSSQDSNSVEQCRSDLAAWTHDFSYGDTAREDQLLTYDQLKQRAAEANRCSLMDDKEPYHTATSVVQTRYSGLMRDRLYDFLVRHDLTAQFQKEDANSLR
jgi:hypothetical protein